MPSTDLSWRYIRPAEGYYLSELAAPTRLPVRTFLPTGYEPNYPYPLLVFFHGHNSSEEQVLRLAPRLSRRNYISIALRGLQTLGPRPDGCIGYAWEADADADSLLEDYVVRAVEQTRRSYHVHSERIYLAGIREGATLAYRMGLMYPDRFAGVISLNGCMPRGGRPLIRLPEVRDLPVLIGHGKDNAQVPLADAQRDFRVLYAAGLPVCMQTYPVAHRLHPDMLRDVNRWIMNNVTRDSSW